MKRFIVICCVAATSLAGTLSAQTSQSEWQAAVGQLEELIADDPAGAARIADDLLKGKNKKNAALLLAVARSYLNAGLPDEATTYLEMARRVDNRNAQLFLLEGDIALARREMGAACQAYEQAIYFDPACCEAYLKYARAYKGASPEEAIAKLRQLKEQCPDCLEADRELAGVYYAGNRFSEAAAAYAAFIDTPLATEEDRVKYAFTLFQLHEFDASLAVVQAGLQQADHSALLQRLALYNYAELERYAEAVTAAEAFFQASDSAAYTYLDYRYYATALAALQQYARAIDAWRACYDALGQEELAPDELFQLGRLYYAEGTSPSDTLGHEQPLQVADSLFARVAELAPDSYLGNFWRARTNSALDPETTAGLAKPYYEQTACLLQAKADPRYNSQLTECYSYLGYYYLLQDDYEASKEYWNKILEIDPENVTAHKALEGM